MEIQPVTDVGTISVGPVDSLRSGRPNRETTFVLQRPDFLEELLVRLAMRRHPGWFSNSSSRISTGIRGRLLLKRSRRPLGLVLPLGGVGS